MERRGRGKDRWTDVQVERTFFPKGGLSTPRKRDIEWIARGFRECKKLESSKL